MPARRITLDQVAPLVPSGSRLMVGGFGLVGAPLNVLKALAASDVRDLTIIANNLGEPGLGLGLLLRNGQIKHAVGSFFTSNPEGVEAIREGRISVELVPQGTMSEAIRAGGAGIAGFFTPTAAGTDLAPVHGRVTSSPSHADAPMGWTTELPGAVEPHTVFQPALTADVALIKADAADELGNLTYRMTARNFNPAMATAAKTVIAEVERVVPAGEMDPDRVVTPHLYVDYIVEASTVAADLGTSSVTDAMRAPTEVELRMARRVRQELRPGDIVNLGIGLPSLVVRHIGPKDGIFIHTENGLLGAGPPPEGGGSALDFPVDAAKHPLTAFPGAAYFDSADSFAMIRGGHVDVAIMGGLQVDASASLANWAVPPKTYGVGGAMDLAAGARRVIVMMHHTTPSGEPKIVRACSLPLTARGCVDMIVTNLGVLRFREGRLVLVGMEDGVGVEEVRGATGAEFEVDLETGGGRVSGF